MEADREIFGHAAAPAGNDNVPAAGLGRAFASLAIAALTDGACCIALVKADGSLTPVRRYDDDHVLIAEWRMLGRRYNLPLTGVLPDGTIEMIEPLTGAASPRRRGSATARRRCRFAARRACPMSQPVAFEARATNVVYAPFGD